jgi:hypothetical protein
MLCVDVLIPKKITIMQTKQTKEELGALKPQSPKRKKKRLREMKAIKGVATFIEELKNYGLECVEWKDAKPFTTVLEFLALRGGHQAAWEASNCIKKHFKKRMYGPKIINQGDRIMGDKNTFRKGSVQQQLKNFNHEKGPCKRRPQRVSGRKYAGEIYSE